MTTTDWISEVRAWLKTKEHGAPCELTAERCLGECACCDEIAKAPDCTCGMDDLASALNAIERLSDLIPHDDDCAALCCVSCYLSLGLGHDILCSKIGMVDTDSVDSCDCDRAIMINTAIEGE